FYPRAQSPEQSQYVVLVAIDDKSVIELKRYGRVFGWPRTLYADLIHRLADARARTIAFDILFDIPTDDDETLADAIDDAAGRSRLVVAPSYGELLSRYGDVRVRWLGFGEVTEPQPVLTAVGSGIGMANQDVDLDGTVRRVPLVFDVNGEPYPSLPLVTL